MQSPEISIIVPVYQAKKYITDCVNSVLEQSFSDFELILVDDGSTDGSEKLLDLFARNARVKVIHKQNGGPVSARKAGITAATGRYVMNLDSDDTLEKGALCALHEYISRFSADVYCFGFYSVTNGKKELVLPNFDEGFYDEKQKTSTILPSFIYDKKRPFYAFGIYPSIWSKIVKRELYMPCQLSINDALVIGEDFALSFLIMHKAQSVYIIKKPFYNYKVLPSSLSRNISVDNWAVKAQVLREFEGSRHYAGVSEGVKTQLGAYLTEMLYDYLVVSAKKSASYAEFAQKEKSIDEIIHKYTDFCKYNFHSPRGLIVVFLIKHRMRRLLWLMAKIRPYRIKDVGNK